MYRSVREREGEKQGGIEGGRGRKTGGVDDKNCNEDFACKVFLKPIIIR
jgi:hypothetical protein